MSLHVLVNGINDNAVPRGPDTYLLCLLPQLLAADPDLHVTLVHAPWQIALAAVPEGPRLTRRVLFPPRRPMPRLLWQATGLVRFANAARPDVTFLPNLIWTPGLRGPSVMTLHDLLHFRAPDKFGRAKAAALRRVIRLAITRTNRLIAVSNFTASDAVMLAGARKDRLCTILEGGPLPQRREGIPQERMFLFVGKIERTKGVTTLIKAFAGSKILAHNGYRLILAGSPGNAEDEVRKLLSRFPQDLRIERPGFLRGDILERHYQACRGFVFPSEAEGFGLVLLEAMSHGAPVIAARATSLPEVVGDAGLIVPPRDVVSLRNAMELLATDDILFADLQSQGYQRLAAFDWAETGRRTAVVLREATA